MDIELPALWPAEPPELDPDDYCYDWEAGEGDEAGEGWDEE